MSHDSREERLRRREAEVERREAAVAAEEQQAAEMVREFGSTARLGSEDAIMRVSELTTTYVKEVLRTVWMAGRPDVAAAMCAAFDGAPALQHPRTARSRSARRRVQGGGGSRSPRSVSPSREEPIEVDDDEPDDAEPTAAPTASTQIGEDDELPDFGGDSD
jgi:hypothetical protein